MGTRSLIRQLWHGMSQSGGQVDRRAGGRAPGRRVEAAGAGLEQLRRGGMAAHLLGRQFPREAGRLRQQVGEGGAEPVRPVTDGPQPGARLLVVRTGEAGGLVGQFPPGEVLPCGGLQHGQLPPASDDRPVVGARVDGVEGEAGHAQRGESAAVAGAGVEAVDPAVAGQRLAAHHVVAEGDRLCVCVVVVPGAFGKQRGEPPLAAGRAAQQFLALLGEGDPGQHGGVDDADVLVLEVVRQRPHPGDGLGVVVPELQAGDLLGVGEDAAHVLALMVAHDHDGVGALAEEPDRLCGLRAPVHQVSDAHQQVVGPQFDLVEEFAEFVETRVDVAHDHSAPHPDDLRFPRRRPAKG
jgi:hypothetical protein